MTAARRVLRAAVTLVFSLLHFLANAVVISGESATVVLCERLGVWTLASIGWPVQRSGDCGVKYEGSMESAIASRKKGHEKVMGWSSSSGGRSGVDGVFTSGLTSFCSEAAFRPSRKLS